MTTRPVFPSGLYGVTPDWDDLDQLTQAIDAAARGGMKVLQWRHKTCPAPRMIGMAREVKRACHANGVLLMINDHWRVAEAVGADGVHVGRDDDSPDAVRLALGPDALIGVSCYGDLNRAKEMLAQGVDYVAFGTMYASATKPKASLADHQILTQARALVAQSGSYAKVVAIGGITAENAAPMVEAGADSIAVVGGLFLSSDIEASARALTHAFA